MSTSSTLSQLVKICFADIEDTGMYFPIKLALLQKREYRIPGSLMKMISKQFLEAALEDSNIEEKVADLLRREPFEHSDLDFFQDYPKLFDIAFSNNFPKPDESFTIELRNTSFTLFVGKLSVARRKLSEDDSEAMFFAKSAIQRGFHEFRVFVRDCPSEGDFRREILYKFVKKLYNATPETNRMFSRDQYRIQELDIGGSGGLQFYFRLKSRFRIQQNHQIIL